MAAAVLVLAGAFVSLADESGDTTRFVSGTKVNGVGVGGLTVDAVSYTHLDVYKRQLTVRPMQRRNRITLKWYAGRQIRLSGRPREI